MSTLIAFLEHRGIDMVLDVGANDGQFASGLRSMGYRGRIVSFEPISAVFAQLSARAAGDSGWDVRQLALGATPGQEHINVSRNSVYSSMLPLTRLATEFDPWATVVRSEAVTVVRLDDIFSEFVGGRVFLKVDTQGFEQAVLEGASQALTSIQGVLLELPVEHLYADVWSLEEALTFMRQSGFVPAQIRPVNMLSDDPTAAIEFDVLFRRSAPDGYLSR
jgi:FkbM family methyltransferase